MREGVGSKKTGRVVENRNRERDAEQFGVLIHKTVI